MIYLSVLLLLFGGMLLYTKLANKYLIFDEPNLRSSHTVATIRGGGVVFLLSILFAGIAYHPVYWLPVSGASAIGVISFLDDNFDLSKGIRFLVHLFSITLLFFFLPVFSTFSFIAILGLYFLVAGIINAYNFMDGINGITGLYSLAVLGALQFVNLTSYPFIEPDLIWFPMLACGVFLFYNYRKRAKVFAGDVGSISIAFWIIFLILDLIIQSGNWTYLLFLSVYGIDTATTIVQRLYLKQNIFEAHRLHLYQLLVNERRLPHRVVSAIYALVQLAIITFLLTTALSFLEAFVFTVFPLLVVYILIKVSLSSTESVAKTEQIEVPESEPIQST